MENMTYLTRATIEMEDIQVIAEEQGYRATLFFDMHQLLNIHLSEDKDGWCQWRKIKREELWFDDNDDYNTLEVLEPRSMFIILYNANYLAEIVKLLREILKKHEGWIDCRGSLKNTYSLNNISDIVSGCP